MSIIIYKLTMIIVFSSLIIELRLSITVYIVRIYYILQFI